MNNHTYTDEHGNVFPWEGPVGDYYRRGPHTSRLPEIRNEVFVHQFDLSKEEERQAYANQLTDIANGLVRPVTDRHLESDGSLKAVLITQRSFACDPEYVKGEKTAEEKAPVEVVDESPKVSEEVTEDSSDESDGESVSSKHITMSSLKPSGDSYPDDFIEEEDHSND